MQKYLATFGAMALGAVMMFWFTHSEVQADSRPEPFVCSEKGEKATGLLHCRSGNISCATREGYVAVSCINTGGLFK